MIVMIPTKYSSKKRFRKVEKQKKRYLLNKNVYLNNNLWINKNMLKI